MRYSKDHAQATRARLLEAAAAALRRHGPKGVSIASIMVEAGLTTHGGFYAHFASKEALVAEAVAHMFATSQARAAAMTRQDPRDQARAFIRAYVSRRHRDQPDQGCPLTTLLNDMAREDDVLRTEIAKGAKRLTDFLDERLPKPVRGRGLAESLMAQMVGAVAMARALPDLTASDALLKRVREDALARLDDVERA